MRIPNDGVDAADQYYSNAPKMEQIADPHLNKYLVYISAQTICLCDLQDLACCVAGWNTHHHISV